MVTHSTARAGIGVVVLSESFEMNGERVERKIDEMYLKVNEMAETLARLNANHERDHSAINQHDEQIRENRDEIGSLQKLFAKVDGQVSLMKLLASIVVAAGTVGAFIWQVWPK